MHSLFYSFSYYFSICIVDYFYYYIILSTLCLMSIKSGMNSFIEMFNILELLLAFYMKNKLNLI